VTRRGGTPEPFRYEDYLIDPAASRLVCRYAIGDRRFEERYTFDPGGDWTSPAADAAARLLYLLAGVSYFKTAAPSTIDLGDVATTAIERAFLRAFYVDGLAEFAYRNDIDLSGLVIEGPDLAERPVASYEISMDQPLIPFGGGIDSVVTVEHARTRFPGAALFVVNGPGGRFEAIERPAAVTGLPILRSVRALDPQLLGDQGRTFLNGHVPVTGIISAAAVLASVLDGRDAVVMSNEWSASVGTLTDSGTSVNHQYSKSLAFEDGLREVLFHTFGPVPRYFSLLRPFSELWVAKRFAALTPYHRAFRSCNGAFRLDPADRLDRWCGHCDKCCFVDLVLAPFLDAEVLGEIFDGHEPLDDQALLPRFRTLAGTTDEAKPFECVGEVGECRAAVLLGAQRPDRAGSPVLQPLADEVRRDGGAPGDVDHQRLMGVHHLPAEYLPHEYLTGSEAPDADSARRQLV
jgi:hypothetical protein